MRSISSTGLIFALLMKATILAAISYPAYGEEQSAQKNSKKAPQEGPIRLESVFVGDKEQPAISYFIPWQGIGTPDKLHWNMENKHDNELNTVDREVMLRSIQLYGDLGLESQ